MWLEQSDEQDTVFTEAMGIKLWQAQLVILEDVGILQQEKWGDIRGF